MRNLSRPPPLLLLAYEQFESHRRWVRLSRCATSGTPNNDGTQALNGIDFDLDHGATVALLGPDGSGKTTFVHHLNGILIGQGSVVIDGSQL